ncbi:serine hydrolase domain-containing protein [Cellulomonas cellasea]|uniref:serine hydrolase domain-containing protein n=1 Tax=Cellulomonas cellasea TaxID=43670 RepID=UPI0025A43C30|nr:serine hydrolase domain-containing protein [Cellulomonas cellasea]MDM8084520.1 serine hydrolase domain-containing protein [Cellulomonas cellasea]
MTLRASTAAAIHMPGGAQDASYGRWHSPTAVVCWASGAKVFTAGLARALVAAGELAWDSHVPTLLGVPGPEHLTIAALVEHRGGLARTLPEQRATLPDPYREWTTERFDERVLPDLEALATAVSPGVEAYSNTGYALLGRALEVSQRQGWIDLVRERLIAPLGMREEVMTVAPPDSPRAEASPGAGAVALASRDLRERPVADWDVSTGPFAAAGGLCSTVPSMLAVLSAALEASSPLAPGAGPHAWTQAGALAAHQGALSRSGSLLVVNTELGSVGVAHAVGGLPGHGARRAERALSNLISRQAPAGARAAP